MPTTSWVSCDFCIALNTHFPPPVLDRLNLVSNTHLKRNKNTGFWYPHVIKKMWSYLARGRPDQNCIPATSRAAQVTCRDSGPVPRKVSFSVLERSSRAPPCFSEVRRPSESKSWVNKQQEPTGCRTQKPNKSIRLVGRVKSHSLNTEL